MKGERTIHFLLKALFIVLLFETNVQTARIVTLHDMQYGMPSQYKSLKRDSSKAKRVQNNDVLRKYKMMDILDKRSAPERIPEFSTKINEQSVFDNLVRKSQERFPSAAPRLYQTSQFAHREPTSSNVQYTEIPVMLYDKAGYTTSGRYSPSVNAETGMPIQENAMNHALTGKHISELEALQGRLGKNSNNMESKGQLAQVTSMPSLCTSERDECIGGRKRGGPKTARPKSVNEVYGLAVKAERKYEEGASTEKGGCVKFSEMSAELLSELERMEKFGNVKMEPRDEIPSVLKLLTSSTECDQGGSVSGRPIGAAAASDRHGRVAAEGGESGAGDAASASQSPAALHPAPERRPQRGARASPSSPVRGASEEEEAETEAEAEGAAEDVDAAFQDIAVSLGGGYPLLGRSAVD